MDYKINELTLDQRYELALEEIKQCVESLIIKEQSITNKSEKRKINMIIRDFQKYIDNPKKLREKGAKQDLIFFRNLLERM